MLSSFVSHNFFPFHLKTIPCNYMTFLNANLTASKSKPLGKKCTLTKTTTESIEIQNILLTYNIKTPKIHIQIFLSASRLVMGCHCISMITNKQIISCRSVTISCDITQKRNVTMCIMQMCDSLNYALRLHNRNTRGLNLHTAESKHIEIFTESLRDHPH